MKYSFIIPLFNEAESLNELYREINEAGSSLVGNFEIIFIDDGSKDDSFNRLKEIRQNDKRVNIIQFRRNMGKSIALSAGFSQANGEIIITLDADLQDDPNEIKKLLTKLDEGYDLVSGWKKERKDPKNKIIPSLVFNKVVRTFSGLPFHDFNCGLKVYRKEVIDQLNLYGELHRFIPIVVHNLGFEVAEVPVAHRARKFGYSKYGWSRIPKGFFDFLTVIFLTNYGTRPIHLFGALGFILILIGIICGIYLSYLRFLGETIGRRPLLFLTMILIVSGFQFFFSGFLAEMILHLSPPKKIYPKNILNNEAQK